MNLASDTHTIKVTVEVMNGAETQRHTVAEITMKLDGPAPLGFATYDTTFTHGDRTVKEKVRAMLQAGYLETVKEAFKVLFREFRS